MLVKKSCLVLGPKHLHCVLFHCFTWPRIPAAVMDSLVGESDGGRLSSMKEKVANFNTKYKQVAAPAPVAVAQTGGSSGAPPPEARILCNPRFAERDRPTDVTQTLLPSAVLPLSEFESSKEFLD